jgi:hypothetical protein
MTKSAAWPLTLLSASSLQFIAFAPAGICLCDLDYNFSATMTDVSIISSYNGSTPNHWYVSRHLSRCSFVAFQSRLEKVVGAEICLY